jgi:hypothetical protein
MARYLLLDSGVQQGRSLFQNQMDLRCASPAHASILRNHIVVRYHLGRYRFDAVGEKLGISGVLSGQVGLSSHFVDEMRCLEIQLFCYDQNETKLEVCERL